MAKRPGTKNDCTGGQQEFTQLTDHLTKDINPGDGNYSICQNIR
jgi:hypothetical protein